MRMRRALKEKDWEGVKNALSEAHMTSSNDILEKHPVYPESQDVANECKIDVQNQMNINDTRRILSQGSPIRGSLSSRRGSAELVSAGTATPGQIPFSNDTVIKLQTFGGLDPVAREEVFRIQDMMDDRMLIQRLNQAMSSGAAI